MDHGSKCHNLHGHRYRIEAWCRGPLFAAGEQTGMVLDFGFLKDEMMRTIDARFDHAFMLCVDRAHHLVLQEPEIEHHPG
ncbi:MAG: 6-carboxytetrahydropterin synthase, partial [Sphingomonas sp.]